MIWAAISLQVLCQSLNLGRVFLGVREDFLHKVHFYLLFLVLLFLFFFFIPSLLAVFFIKELQDPPRKPFLDVFLKPTTCKPSCYPSLCYFPLKGPRETLSDLRLQPFGFPCCPYSRNPKTFTSNPAVPSNKEFLVNHIRKALTSSILPCGSLRSDLSLSQTEIGIYHQLT